jgi:hypothetical protein
MSISIHNFAKRYKANPNNYSIPDFQRIFQWKPAQIEKFFDSILRNFPLPRFFVWELNEASNKSLTLYQIPNRFDSTSGTPSEVQVPNEIVTTAICDGQQRLTSILIGINGLKYGTGKSKEPKFLYFNVLSDINNTATRAITQEDKKDVTFVFLTDKEANELHPNIFYIKVKELYKKIDEYYDSSNDGVIIDMLDQYNFSQIENYNNEIQDNAVDNIKYFYKRIKANYLDFVDIGESIGNDYGDIVEFFLRINNENKPLKKNQILYSLLCKYFDSYPNVNLKDDFEKITNLPESKPIFKGLDGTYEFFLRTALYISTDLILFKKDTFKQSHATSILSQWNLVKKSLVSTIKLINELNLENIITSVNSLIPVVYHLYKKNNILTTREKREILKYIVRAQFSNVFGSHGDTLLLSFRNAQRQAFELNENYEFSVLELSNALLDRNDNKRLHLSKDEIISLTELKYGNDKTRPLLNLIYKELNFGITTFEVDHFHPSAICKLKSKLIFNNVNEGDHQFIRSTYNCLPNLQLLKSECNNEKRDKPIVDWIKGIIKADIDYGCLNGKTNFKDYILDNKIKLPEGEENKTEEAVKAFISLDNYVDFYNIRKKYFQYILWEELGDVSLTENPFA